MTEFDTNSLTPTQRLRARNAAIRQRMLDRVGHKIRKCARCAAKKPLSEFGFVGDDFQEYCKDCKNDMAKTRITTQLNAYVRHHFGTRMREQLGNLRPHDLQSNIERYMGCRITAVIIAMRKRLKVREPHKSLKKAILEEGYHIDHITPLTSFKVIMTDNSGSFIHWPTFRACWAPGNLEAIPADVNLAKGARVE